MCLTAKNPKKTLLAATVFSLSVWGTPFNAAALEHGGVDIDVGEQAAVPASDVCGSSDSSDTAARAYKNMAGNTVLFDTAQTNRIIFGKDLKHLMRDCKSVVYQGGHDADQSKHNDRQWIHSTWTEDGQTVYALVHNEFQGHNHLDKYPMCKGHYQECWRNSVVMAVSYDGGKTFNLLPEKDRLVIDLPYAYTPMIGKSTGFMNPSNMITQGDYIMAFVASAGYKDQLSGNYLIRKLRTAPWTSASWEVYNGKTFVSIQASLKAGKPAGKPVQLGITQGKLPFADPTPMKVQSVAKHMVNGKWDGKFVALMSAKAPAVAEAWRDGFYIATSFDLLNWSQPMQLLSGPLRDTFACAAAPKSPLTIYRYGALIDENASEQMFSRNFEFIGDNPMLYTTRINYTYCGGSAAKGGTAGLRKMKVYMSRLIRETSPL